MKTPQAIINKAPNRNVEEIDLGAFFPKQEELAAIDLRDFLFKGLIVKETDFRTQVQATDWSVYEGKYVSVYCSTDAIVPMWAFMLVAVSLAPFAKDVAVTPPSSAYDIFQQRIIAKIDFTQYEGKRVIVKGCGMREVQPECFSRISFELAKVARSLMYGEACSSVPVFKKLVDAR